MGGISAAMQNRIALRMITSATLTTCLVLARDIFSTGGNLYSDAYQTQPVPKTWLLKGLNPTAPGLFGSESMAALKHMTQSELRVVSSAPFFTLGAPPRRAINLATSPSTIFGAPCWPRRYSLLSVLISNLIGVCCSSGPLQSPLWTI